MIGNKVNTPYGRGVIIEDRGNIVVVKPNSWVLANNKPPTFYLNIKDIKFFEVGDKVTTSFGTGLINDIRADGVHIVTLNNWSLANGKSPTLYLNQSAIKPSQLTNETPAITTSTEKPKESKVKSIDEILLESLDKALSYKTEATELFKAKQYEKSRAMYMQALNVLRVSYKYSVLTRIPSNMFICCWHIYVYLYICIVYSLRVMMPRISSKPGHSS